LASGCFAKTIRPAHRREDDANRRAVTDSVTVLLCCRRG
jgi:hypothetical protein